MKYLSQRDPKYASDKLGSSSLTLGKFGCTTTAISMLSDYFGCYVTPQEMAHNVNYYTTKSKNRKLGGGLIIWGNLNFDKMKFTRREHGRSDRAIQAALSDPNRAVILEVNNGTHWVVGVKRNLFGNDYTCIDPWDGKKKNLLASYKNITGAAYFERKELEESASAIDAHYAQLLGDRDYPFFIQVERHGELWFVHADGRREYLHPDNIMAFMMRHAEGITNANLEKLPIKK